jgi:hypothetical protein
MGMGVLTGRLDDEGRLDQQDFDGKGRFRSKETGASTRGPRWRRALRSVGSVEMSTSILDRQARWGRARRPTGSMREGISTGNFHPIILSTMAAHPRREFSKTF